MTYGTPRPTPSTPTDYSQWSIEELWQFAAQLRVAGARTKNRRQLIDLFVPPSPKATRR